MNDLIAEIQNCRACAATLPHVPNPVITFNEYSKIVIVGQAPGRRVHETGIPWNDQSGKKLRDWLGVSDADFYNPAIFSIIPMGFCYPGKGKSGDLPPRPECAKMWHDRIFSSFKSDPLIILIGQYAQRHYLNVPRNQGLTHNVKNYKGFLPTFFPLPHPSPRNQHWLKMNPWFTDQVLFDLKTTVFNIIKDL